MANRQRVSAFKTIRYYLSVTAIYAVTLLTMFKLLQLQFMPVSIPLGDKAYAATQAASARSQLIFNLPDVVAGNPVRLVIPSVNIDIEVIDGTYNPSDGSWSLSEKQSHYANITAPANNKRGNTLIYGHYNKYVFLTLHGITDNSKAYVYTSNNHVFTYSLVEHHEVQPTDTKLFDYDGPPILTVQTCSGTFYEKRNLFTFKFESVK